MTIRKFYVYILLCGDDSYYTGVTNNLRRRYKEHCSGYNETSYTFSRQPLNLVYYETYKNILKAIKREKQIKGWVREKKEALIASDVELLKQLSRKKF